MSKQRKILLYFADPMCSWCWGFSPDLKQIYSSYGEQLPIALILGGLRPGTTEPMQATMREEILHHWHSVAERTDQPFEFDGALPDGFVYDTEPASRAVVAMGELKPKAVLPYFSALQDGFYARGLDITKVEVLADLSGRYVDDRDAFLQAWHSDTAKATTQAHFQRTRQFGVRGFPSLILQAEQDFELLTHGYRSYLELEKPLAEWLNQQHQRHAETV